MKSEWTLTVTSPLGEEPYNMAIEESPDGIKAFVSDKNGRGSATLTEVIGQDLLVLSTKIETPMKTTVYLYPSDKNFVNSQSFNGILKIGEFSEMLVSGVKND